MESKWEYNGEGNFTLKSSIKDLAKITITKNHDYSIQIEDQAYSVFKNSKGIKIYEKEVDKEESLLILENQGILFNKFKLTYLDKSYSFEVKNNPLVEYSIKDNDGNALSYSISNSKEQKGIHLKIKSNTKNSPILFHALLFILIHPVLRENTTDAIWWTMAM